MESDDYFGDQRQRLVELFERQMAECVHNLHRLTDVIQHVVSVGQVYIEIDEIWQPTPKE